MTSITTLWGSSNTTSINSSSITSGSTAVTSAISNSGQSGTEVTITIAYNASATAGVNVYVLRDVGGGNFETYNNDAPFAFQMPYTAGGTNYRAFTVMADRVSNFKILINNTSGQSCTATVGYKQSSIQAL